MENNIMLPKHKALNNSNVRALFEQDKITRAQLFQLNPLDRKKAIKFFNYQVNHLKGIEWDAFIEKTQDLIDADDIWETNHAKITNAITNFMELTGSVPSKAKLANDTGLSRMTIHRHLQKFRDHDSYHDENKSISMMHNRIISRFARAALKGDIKAAKLYFQIDKAAHKTVIANQNNNIQINNTIINQHVIEQLKPEQLQQIEQILTANSESKQA